jgi:metallo-beta-lactamase class B
MMRRALALGLVVGFCGSAWAVTDWNTPQEPFELYGNTWYVGTHDVSSVLITSPGGHVLIDGGDEHSPALIVAHIRQLGFKVEDIRYILNSHVHRDHAGGIAQLQRLSGATVLSSVLGERVLRTGLTAPDDPQLTDLPPSMPAVANTRAVRDGEVVTIGSVSVTAHYTPGHTSGGMSWTWQASEHGKAINLVYADSLSARASRPFRYSGYPTYPDARTDLEHSIALVAALPCDLLVSAHPDASGLWDRLGRQPKLGNAAFIDKRACHSYANHARQQLAATLASENSAQK